MTGLIAQVQKELNEWMMLEPVDSEDIYPRIRDTMDALGFIRHFATSHPDNPEITLGLARNVLVVSIRENTDYDEDPTAIYTEIIAYIDGVVERNNLTLPSPPPRGEMSVPMTHLLKMEMQESETKRALFDSWVDTFGSEKDFARYVDAVIQPFMLERYTLFGDRLLTEGYSQYELHQQYPKCMNCALRETRLATRSRNPDIEVIKPILILFSITYPGCASGLARWITREHAPYFIRIAEMLGAGIPAQDIDKFLGSDLDISILQSMGANTQSYAYDYLGNVRKSA